jgi:hypothetical protein
VVKELDTGPLALISLPPSFRAHPVILTSIWDVLHITLVFEFEANI